MIGATVVQDSVSPEGKRLTSVGIVAHRFILAEINTHRVLSRSYRSSRAVPSKRLIEEVRNDPAMPVHWGANRPGMQAHEELDDSNVKPGWLVSDRGHTKRLWRDAAVEAARAAELMARAGLHKQVANRVLEPFIWAHGVITATEWDNFFGLRLHSTAQPEFRALADDVWRAMKSSVPNRLVPGQWHLPYVNVGGQSDAGDSAACMRWCAERKLYGDAWLDLLIKRSVARCARSSYKSFDTDAPSTIEEDLATYAKLNIPGTEYYDPTQPIHASPAEHQATPDASANDFSDAKTHWSGWENAEQHGNFIGWRQYRKMLDGEACAPLPKEYGE